MTQIQINKTWNDRMTGHIINHFFENMRNDNNEPLPTRLIFGVSSTYTQHINSIRAAYNSMTWFLASKEALEEIDNLNTILYNSTEEENRIPENSIYKIDNVNSIETLIDGIWYIGHTLNCHFGHFINNNIAGKENAYWRPISNLDFDNFFVYPDAINNKITIKYTVPFKLLEHFNHQTFINGGNTDLFLVIPYIGPDRYRGIRVYNPNTGNGNMLSSYIALKITDINGDGDIKFDHIDDIDYFDSLEFTLTTPHLI